MKLEEYIDLDRELRIADASGRLSLAWGGKDTEGRSDEELLRHWVRNEGRTRGAMGEVAAAAFRWSCVIAAMSGLAAGVAAAAALLRYDGGQPINVLLFLAVLIGFQILLIPFLLLAFLFRRRWGVSSRLAGAVVGRVTRRALRAEATRRATGGAAAEIEEEWDALQAKGSLFARVRPVLILSLLQVFGVMFNAAALLTLVFLVSFSDLAFAWSTTLDVPSEGIHRVTTILSAPWAAVWPEARPSLQLVESTRFVRLEGSFAGSPESASLLAGGWWRFLAAAVFTYGFLPRLAALIACGVLLRCEMARALARNERVRVLAERLRTPQVRVEHDASERPEAPPAPDGAAMTERESLPDRPMRLAVVFWGYDRSPEAAAVDRLLQGTVEARAVMTEEAGRLDRPDTEVAKRLEAASRSREIDGAAVFFEPFEPPKTDARRFLRLARGALGETAPLLVMLGEYSGDGMLPPSEPERRTWQKALRGMSDPFLFLKTVPAE